MKTIKCSFKKLSKNSLDYTFLHEVITRSNDLIFVCSHFIRSYILYEFSVGNDLPNMDIDFIKKCFSVICKKGPGPKIKNNVGLIRKLTNYYFTSFYKLINPNKIVKYYDYVKKYVERNFREKEKIENNEMNKIIDALLYDTTDYSDCYAKWIKYNKPIINEKLNKYRFNSKNLSYIIGSASKGMKICYENNIKLNFFKYVCQYVNQNFKQDLDNEINRYKQLGIMTTTDIRKQIKKDLQQVKNDLIYGTFTSPKKYHNWIKEQKKIIFPLEYKKSYETDIKHYPNKYIKHMLTMNKYLEDNRLKTFQPICLRTNIYDKYITINTNTLVDILPELENKNSYFSKIDEIKDYLWNTYFNIKKFRLKNYSFNGEIQTDGYSVSLNFISNNEILKSKEIKKKKLEASKKAKRENKGKTRKQIEKERIKKEEEKINKKIEYIEKQKEIREKERKEKAKLPKEEQDKINLDKRIKKNEFNYISDLLKYSTFMEDFKKAHNEKRIVYGDPGKRSPLTLLGDNGKIFNYTTKRRIKETKRNKINKLIDNKKNITSLSIFNELTIKKYEEFLAKLSKKTVNLEKFNKYARLKLNFRKEITKEENYNTYVRKLKWFAYINKRRHEDKLLDELKKTYGQNAIMVIGDWGNKGRLSYISTPNIGIKRLLKKGFGKVYHLDEYKTSKIHHKTHTECKNLTIKCFYKKKLNLSNSFEGPITSEILDKHIKNLKKIKLHSVLTFKMSNGIKGCINRDINAVKNMKYIVEQLIKNKKRPEIFSRQKIKPTNLVI